MNTLRRFSRRAWLLHGYLIASLVLLPVPFVHSGWIDTDTDAVNDTWEDTANSSSYTLAQLDALDADLDIDNDGAYNSEELAYGSDLLISTRTTTASPMGLKSTSPFRAAAKPIR